MYHQEPFARVLLNAIPKNGINHLWGAIIAFLIVSTSAMERVQAQNMEDSLKKEINEKFILVSTNLSELKTNISMLIIAQSKKDSDQDEQIKKLQESDKQQNEKLKQLEEERRKRKEERRRNRKKE